MDAKMVARRAQADSLRNMWSTHTCQSEPVRESFFQEVDRAVESGRMAPVSLIGDMLCVALPTGSIFVLFPSQLLKSEFVSVVQELLIDDPSVPRLLDRV